MLGLDVLVVCAGLLNGATSVDVALDYRFSFSDGKRASWALKKRLLKKYFELDS